MRAYWSLFAGKMPSKMMHGKFRDLTEHGGDLPPRE